MSFLNCKIVGQVANPSDYFTQSAERGHPDFEISSSTLKVFSVCPSRWRDGYTPPESDSKEYGNLLDCLVLTPEQFTTRYAVRPDTYVDEKGITKDWHHASKTCKAWLSEHAGFEIVSAWDYKEAKKSVDRLRKDLIISTFLDCSDKQVWVTGQWHDEATGITFPVKCMIDAVPRYDTPFLKNIGDLKTARNASIEKWQRTVWDFKYHVQGAFNLDIYRAAMPSEDRVNFCHLIQESYAPYQTARRILSEKFLELGRAEYTRALSNYAWCLKNNRWPDYDENEESCQGWSITEPSAWMEGAFLFSPRFSAEKQPLPKNDDDSDLVP